jgi:hypothetical protein
LALLGAALLAVRVAFLARHLGDLDALWSDYARRGLRFQFARILDALTLIIFAAVATWALWGVNAQTPDRFGRVFVAWLGFFLLERLPVHRFPRTNIPGGFDGARASLAANALIAALGAFAATLVSAIYFWWRG